MGASSAHTGAIGKLLATIRDRGSVFARDLADASGLKQRNVMNLLGRAAKDGTLRKDIAATDTNRGRRELVRYTWVGESIESEPTPPAKEFKPCLGGCGKKIPRDGITFLCVPCRQRNAGASPYAP